MNRPISNLSFRFSQPLTSHSSEWEDRSMTVQVEAEREQERIRSY